MTIRAIRLKIGAIPAPPNQESGKAKVCSRPPIHRVGQRIAPLVHLNKIPRRHNVRRRNTRFQKILVSRNDYVHMRGNRRAKNGAIRSIPHENFIRYASVGCLNHLNNRQDQRQKAFQGRNFVRKLTIIHPPQFVNVLIGNAPLIRMSDRFPVGLIGNPRGV